MTFYKDISSPGFALPLQTQGKRWTGFYHSQTKKAGNRYAAKCSYCLIELVDKPERLHQHVLHCSDWPLSERTKYLQKITSENLISRKCSNDHLDNEENDSSTEPTIYNNDNPQELSNPQELPTPRQNTITNWCIRPLS
ncbi:2523_t:CDS:2 [Cetraspora pellucida]|uniref:2523_t:CDS:1 n=1 Tax=Cetraspora pellucida TaxID=1433469 RepID=A0ACA9KGK2_9GLOM|nr:2523_t:CDS:2 [Cetraspora pellucida]